MDSERDWIRTLNPGINKFVFTCLICGFVRRGEVKDVMDQRGVMSASFGKIGPAGSLIAVFRRKP